MVAGSKGQSQVRKNRARALTVAVPFPEPRVFAMVYRTREARLNRIQKIFSHALTVAARNGSCLFAIVCRVWDAAPEHTPAIFLKSLTVVVRLDGAVLVCNDSADQKFAVG